MSQKEFLEFKQPVTNEQINDTLEELCQNVFHGKVGFKIPQHESVQCWLPIVEKQGTSRFQMWRQDEKTLWIDGRHLDIGFWLADVTLITLGVYYNGKRWSDTRGKDTAIPISLQCLHKTFASYFIASHIDHDKKALLPKTQQIFERYATLLPDVLLGDFDLERDKVIREGRLLPEQAS